LPGMPKAICLGVRYVPGGSARGLWIDACEPKFWGRATDSGHRLKCGFCPICGLRLWHELESPSETITIKAGSLNASVDVSTAIHIRVSCNLAGMIIPAGAKQFSEEEPE
jgi:hypothetical protein